MDAVLFYLFGAFALSWAVTVVAQRNPLYSAFALVVTLCSLSAIFGLLGVMVAYGRTRGGAFGVAVLRQYGQWALIMFIFGFFMSNVNNWGHAGGFVGGYLMALALGPVERGGERGLDRLAALAAIAVTALAFLLALRAGFGA